MVFVRSVSSSISGGVSMNEVNAPAAALWMSTSTGPRSARIFAKVSLTAAASPMSTA